MEQRVHIALLCIIIFFNNNNSNKVHEFAKAVKCCGFSVLKALAGELI